MAQGPGWVPHLLTFQEQGLQRDDPPEITAIYIPDQKAYKCYWHRGPPCTPEPASTSTSSTTGRMATQCHQRARPLQQRHGTLPPSPGRGIPPDGHARPHNHHRRHERRPHPGGPRGTGHTPEPCSLRHHRNAGARGPDGQPRRPTIPLPPPNRCCPLPHQRMLWRPHHHHPGGGPIWTPPAGTHRP